MNTRRGVAEIDDQLRSALDDPIRRRLLDILLGDGPNTSTTLSHQLPVTRQAVAKHLTVPDRAGRVRMIEHGRERRYRIDEEQFSRAVRQLQTVGDSWDARLSRIQRLAEQIEQTKKAK